MIFVQTLHNSLILAITHKRPFVINSLRGINIMLEGVEAT
jgi:hypothetical protein